MVARSRPDIVRTGSRSRRRLSVLHQPSTGSAYSSAHPPAAVAVYRFCTSGSALWLAVTVLFLAYAAFYDYGFIRMLRHYHLPFDNAFWLRVKDLEKLADKWHTTYQKVNLIIFVLFFLMLSGANIWLSYYIYHP